MKFLFLTPEFTSLFDDMDTDTMFDAITELAHAQPEVDTVMHVDAVLSDLVFSNDRLTRAVEIASFKVLDDAVDDFIRLKKNPSFFFKVMKLTMNLEKYGWDRKLETWEVVTLRQMLDAMYISHEDGEAEQIESLLTDH